MRNVDEVTVLEYFMGRRGPFGLKDLDCFASAMMVVSNPQDVRQCWWLDRCGCQSLHDGWAPIS